VPIYHIKAERMIQPIKLLLMLDQCVEELQTDIVIVQDQYMTIDAETRGF
jgi:hypothetical protein